ncbi:MAG: glycosyltransferase family 39 protein [Candidatus Melainabacteria bacterium]|nr:glycosyltransferase family 39 protein [Candidatus Melainabacteria bacterium]
MATTEEKKEEKTKDLTHRLDFFGEFLLFTVAALIVLLWFNFATNHVNAFSAADASEYLRYATALSQVNWLSPHFAQEAFKEFIITGPTFPLVLVAFNWLTTFRPFDPANSTTPLILQSLVSALTTGFIYVTARQLYNQSIGRLAALMSLFYPAFIVNSGRLYSEVFATFLECACFALFAALPQSARKKYIFLALLGATLVALQLTRSSMLLFTFASMVFVLLADFNKLDLKGSLKACGKSLLAFLLGASALLAPWLLYEKTVYNKLSLVVDRVGHYNLFIGTNAEIQGFLSYPYPDGHGIEQKSFLELIESAHKKSPNGFIRLLLDKPARLYKFPWNDYRAPIGPVDFQWQVFYHQIIIAGALLGLAMALGFALNNELAAKKKLLGRLYLLSGFVLNLPYLLFITVPRYNLAAMPVLLTFAAAGFYITGDLIKNHQAKWAKVCAGAWLFLFLYLRDDFSSLSASLAPYSLYIVQGTDLFSKGLIASLAALAAFLSMAKCLAVFVKREYQGFALLPLIGTGLAVCLLTALPQRANGRIGENLIKFQGGTISNTTYLPAETVQKQGRDCYLFIDSDQGQILRNATHIKINGVTCRGPFIPGLAAVDNWYYLKSRKDNSAYLECTYIFDCMTQASGISNLDIRQWYLVPVPTAVLADAPVQDGKIKLQVEIESSESLTLFAEKISSDRKGQSFANKPSLNIYSWEKAFYGVENDRALTDSRFDLKLPVNTKENQATIKLQNQNLPLSQTNLNLHIVAGPPSQSLNKNANADALVEEFKEKIESSGSKEVVLQFNPAEKSAKSPARLDETYKLLELEISKAGSAPYKVATAQMIFEQKDGRTLTMDLPYFKKPANHLCLGIPLPVSVIARESKLVTVRLMSDEDCRLRLALKELCGHPLGSGHEIY